MPLSEDEQRILSQIEQQLYETDPALAREVGSTTVYTHAARNLRWSLVGLVVGLVAMLATLTVSYWLAFVGFLIMLVSALYLERNARHLGKVGLQQLSQACARRSSSQAAPTATTRPTDARSHTVRPVAIRVRPAGAARGVCHGVRNLP